jgi:Family of unknown function (DUF5681)
MSGSDDSDKEKTIGYKSPPVATRFQKGQSGNPNGRPKGRKSIKKIFSDALLRTIEVREGERVRSLPKIQVAIEVNLNKALRGDHRAFVKVMDVATKWGILEPAPDEQKIFANETTRYRDELARLIDAEAINIDGLVDTGDGGTSG